MSNLKTTRQCGFATKCYVLKWHFKSSYLQLLALFILIGKFHRASVEFVLNSHWTPTELPLNSHWASPNLIHKVLTCITRTLWPLKGSIHNADMGRSNQQQQQQQHSSLLGRICHSSPGSMDGLYLPQSVTSAPLDRLIFEQPWTFQITGSSQNYIGYKTPWSDSRGIVTLYIEYVIY